MNNLVPNLANLLWSLFFVFISNPIFCQSPEQQQLVELSQKARKLMEVGNYSEALKLREQAADIALKTYSDQDTFYIEQLSQIAILSIRLADFERAEKLLKKIEPTVIQLYGKESLPYSGLLTNLGILYWETQRINNLYTVFEEVTRIKRIVLGDAHPDYASSLNNLAIVCRDLGYLEKAEALNLTTLAIWEKTIGKENPNYVGCQNNLAVLYTDMGREHEAELLFLEVYNSRKKQLGEMHPQYALSVGNLASLYLDMGDYAQAEKWYLEADVLWAKILGKEHPQYADNLAGLATVYNAMKAYDKAEKILQESEKIILKVYGTMHDSYALNLGELAEIAESRNNLELATNLFLESITIYLQTSGKQSYGYIRQLNNLAENYLKRNLLDSVFYYCKLSLSSNANVEIDENKLSQLGDLDYTFDDQFHVSISILYDVFEKDPKANQSKINQLLQVALNSSKKKRQHLGEDSDKLLLVKHLTSWEKIALEQAVVSKKMNEIEQAFVFSEESKSMLLMETLRAQEAQNFGELPDSVAQKEKDLNTQLEQLKAALSSASSEAKSAILEQINGVNKASSMLKKEIKQKFPKYHEFKYNNENIELAKIQEQLEKKQVMLVYTWLDTSLFAFVIQKQQVQLVQLLEDTKELSTQISEFRKSISDYQFITKQEQLAYKTYIDNAFGIYQKVVLPLLPAKASMVTIIADGALTEIPFEALLTELPTQILTYKELPYLLNQLTINYNYSAALFKDSKQSGQKQLSSNQPPKLLAFAASYKKEESANNTFRALRLQKQRNSLGDLPSAKEELKKIASTFEGTFLYGKDANELNFKKQAESYDVIHLAMHGLLNKHHPLLSSLVFSENNDKSEDNFLQAYEISQLKLNAKLVVLSACETGYGKFVKGEGVMSIARSFMYAGVPSLVVSLWQVNDHSTSILMELFYSNLKKGFAKDEALRQAKLHYIQKTEGIAAHPAFWSPFIQLGDSSSIVHKNNYWWVYSLLGLLIAIIGVALNKKYKYQAG